MWFAPISLSFMVLWLVAAVYADCPAYDCGKSSQYNKTTCAFYSNETYFLQECPSGKLCNFTANTLNSSCIPDQKSVVMAYPGEPCTTKHNPCMYGNCTHGYCQSQQFGDPCSISDECMPGLRCLKKKCQNLLKAGETGCTDDYDCVISAGCNFKECVRYFSLSTKTNVETCNNYSSYLCSSGACANGACVDAPRSSSYPPIRCESSYDCVSIGDNGMIYYGDCVCGYNTEGTSYCSLFPGDDLYENYLMSLGNWLTSEISDRCNTKRRYDSYCIDSFWDKPNFQELEIFFEWTFNYSLLQQNPGCVKNTLTNDYWSLVEDVDYSLILGLIGILLA